MEQGWWRKGKCRTYPEPAIFFAADKEVKKQRAAKAVCRGCPVRFDCLEDALISDIHEGIQGGATPRERMILKGMVVAKGLSLHGLKDSLTQIMGLEIRTGT